MVWEGSEMGGINLSGNWGEGEEWSCCRMVFYRRKFCIFVGWGFVGV